MRVLVAYYSRSGHTDQVAHRVASALGADVERIVEPKSRAGVLGYLRSGRDAVRRLVPRIEDAGHNPASYDLVVVGSPVWAGHLSSPVRAFLLRHRKDFGAVAFFCTCGGSGFERALREMEDVAGKKPADVLALRERDLRVDYGAKIDRFVRELRAVLEPERVQPAAPA